MDLKVIILLPMCSAIYMEINNQYKMKGSNVYSCMLDASKVFDRVHFGTLFKLLLKRNLPLDIVKSLLHGDFRIC